MFASAHGWMKEKEGMGAVSGRQTGIYTAINHGARPSVRERRIAHLDDDDEGVAHGRADGRTRQKTSPIERKRRFTAWENNNAQ